MNGPMSWPSSSWRSAPKAASSRVDDRLPLAQAEREQVHPRLQITPIEHAHVSRIGAQVDARCPLVELEIDLGAGDPVAGGSIDVLEPDLTRPLELRGIRMARSFAVVEVEDARWLAALL